MRPLRLLYNTLPPWRYDCLAQSRLQRSYGCPNPGATAEIFGYLLNKAQLPYTLMEDTQSDSYRGLLDAIENGTADTALVFWTPLDSRLARFVPTERLAVSQMFDVGATRRRKLVSAVFAANASAELDPMSKHFQFLNVYSTAVWLCVFSVMLLSRVYVSLLLRLQHSEPHPHKRLAAFIPGVGLSAVLLALTFNLYRAGLLSSLLVRPPEVLWFNSVRELFTKLQAGETKLLVRPGSAIQTFIREERRHLQQPPFEPGLVAETNSMQQAYKRLADQQQVYIGYNWNIKSTLDQCGFRVVDLEFIARTTDHLGLVMLFNKRWQNSSELAQLNAVMRVSEDFVESTIQRYERYLRVVVPQLLRHCPVDDQPGPQSRTPRFISSVALADFTGIYAVYAIGLVAAGWVVMLLCECGVSGRRLCATLRRLCWCNSRASSSSSSSSPTSTWRFYDLQRRHNQLHLQQDTFARHRMSL